MHAHLRQVLPGHEYQPPCKATQCAMKLSLLQLAGHCAKCGFVCIQCFVSANRKVSYDGRIDASDN